MTDRLNGSTQPNPTEGDGLIDGVLASIPVSSEFERKCERAAMLAYSIEKIRRERERRGFMAMTVRGYLDRLMRHAGLDSLQPVQDGFGLLPDFSVSTSSIANIAKLLREIGLTIAEATAMVRVSFAEQNGMPFSLQASESYRGPGIDDPRNEGVSQSRDLLLAEAALHTIELRYPREFTDDLSLMLHQLNAHFPR